MRPVQRSPRRTRARRRAQCVCPCHPKIGRDSSYEQSCACERGRFPPQPRAAGWRRRPPASGQSCVGAWVGGFSAGCQCVCVCVCFRECANTPTFITSAGADKAIMTAITRFMWRSGMCRESATPPNEASDEDTCIGRRGWGRGRMWACRQGEACQQAGRARGRRGGEFRAQGVARTHHKAGGCGPRDVVVRLKGERTSKGGCRHPCQRGCGLLDDLHVRGDKTHAEKRCHTTPGTQECGHRSGTHAKPDSRGHILPQPSRCCAHSRACILSALAAAAVSVFEGSFGPLPLLRFISHFGSLERAGKHRSQIHRSTNSDNRGRIPRGG